MTADARVLPNRLLPLPTLYQQATVTGLLAGWADWLFFGHGIGVGFTIFIVGLAAAIVLIKRSQIHTPRLTMAMGVLLIALLPALEDVNLLSVFFGIAGIVCFVLIVHNQLRISVMDWFYSTCAFLLRMPFRLPGDSRKALKARRRWKAATSQRLGLTVWIVPIGFSLVFLGLFSNANPLIEDWLAHLDLTWLVASLNFDRVIFWCAALLVCWPFIRFKPLRKLIARQAKSTSEQSPLKTSNYDLFSEPAIFRSLMMFNLLFGLQISLDATYLLGAAELPDGMTYAQYAHRGAYPLICTALLAAAFILFATRPGSTSEHSGRVRSLILAWTVQNVTLVGFSIQRLDLYVEAYALTYWRFAAFIWMVLVLIGLVLIVAKFAKGKSNTWLIETNLMALVVVLYATSFVNVSSVIADYNVNRSLENSKHWLDVGYLHDLGPYAIQAIDRADAHKIPISTSTQYRRGRVKTMPELTFARKRMAARFSSDGQNWRTWSFRRYRLQRYLDSSKPSRVPNRNYFRVPNGNHYNAR